MKIKTKPLNWGDLKNGIEIDIPIPEARPLFSQSGLTDIWKSKVTIFNDIPKTALEERHFDKFVIELCNIQGGTVTRADGTIQNVVNAKTIITKDIAHYKSPAEYSELPVDERESYYTVRSGDFVVFGEVDDVVTTAAEFSQLQQKYKDNGIKISSISVNINGMAVDNITMANV